MANYSELELHLQDEHFETIADKIGAFLLFDPYRAKNLTFDLFFNNFETVTTSWIGQTIQRNDSSIWFLTTLKQLLNLTPVQILLPQASCTGCDSAAI